MDLKPLEDNDQAWRLIHEQVLGRFMKGGDKSVLSNLHFPMHIGSYGVTATQVRHRIIDVPLDHAFAALIDEMRRE